MPRVSAFYGISIYMYFDETEHEGRPHFHARHAGRWASFAIDPLHLLANGLTGRDVQLVLEWAEEHRDELLGNWERARRHARLARIAPLT